MTYTKYHLKLSKDSFIPASPLPIEEVHNDYGRFLKLMERVGKPSGWDKRSEYHDTASIGRLKDIFRQESSRLWLFKDGSHETGFCQVANVEDLSGLFNQAAGISEIYKIGLFPEFIGQGKGAGYVTSVLKELFKQSEMIYLNTRDTNKVNSVPFYERLGFEVVKRELGEDELVPMGIP